MVRVFPLAIPNQSLPSYSLFQVGIAALSGWDVSHLAVRGCGEASLLCSTALKSSHNQHPCICCACQRLDAAGHITVANTHCLLTPCR